MKKIIVSTTNDLTTDQRVQRICKTLSEQPYKIVLVGRKKKDSLALDRPYKTKRFSLLINKGFLFYASYNIRLFFYLLFTKKDYLLANDLDTLLANYLVSKLQQKKLIYDSHELFTEIPELLDRPFVKKCWAFLEKHMIPSLTTCYTVSPSIAAYYCRKYHVNFQVIRNLPQQFNLKETALPFITNNKKILLYQGSLNLGRGLELLIDTLAFLENHLLVLIGSGDLATELKARVNRKKLGKKVLFLGKLLPEKLRAITPHAAIGFSLEEDLGLNYRYALPNKIFDYIQAEVPVLVSDLPEMKQVVTEHQVGEIANSRNPEQLAEQIQSMLLKDFTAGLKKAKNVLCWEREEKKLIAIFDQIDN